MLDFAWLFLHHCGNDKCGKTAAAGLPTVEHNELHSASPRWLFVSDYKKPRTKSRVDEEEHP